MTFFVLALAAGLFGGFRGRLFLILLFFFIQFFFEGLWKTRWLPVLAGVIVLGAACILPFTSYMPKAFQRALSFLPVDVDPVVKQDAEQSTQWRVQMWQTLWPEVPTYLWLGKGYAFSPTDLYLTELAQHRGMTSNYETAILTSEYHNGPLSVIVPFGIPGAVAFLWFLGAGWMYLYKSYRLSGPDLKKVNTCLLSYYTVRVIFFFAIYGSFYLDILVFSSIIGLSIALNKPQQSRVESSSGAAGNEITAPA
jgi:O-antigen ligase